MGKSSKTDTGSKPAADYAANLTNSSGSALTMESIQAFVDSVPKGVIMDTLYAPNERVAEQWRKDFPGFKVELSQRLPLTDSQVEPSKNAPGGSNGVEHE